MNPNIVLPSRSLPDPWRGVESINAADLRAGDVVLGRAGACGACTVVAIINVKGTPYISFYCCGGLKRPDAMVTVASPRIFTGVRAPKPAHPLCVCTSFSK